MKKFLLYGCTGYTGSLTARMAVAQGMNPLLAGRNESKVKKIAEELKCDYRVFDLNETEKLEAALEEVSVVLHCAGPYSKTWEAMAMACLKTGTHYTDITGEIPVFASLQLLDKKARDQQIMMMPGVGMDVVPTDCLALKVKEEMPDAVELNIGLKSKGGRISHGTAKTVVENLGGGSAIRRNGKLKTIPQGSISRQMDFGEGEEPAMVMPWGDVFTAFYTTGIPNITVYFFMPRKTQRYFRMSNYFGWLLSAKWLQRILKRRVDKMPAGPSAKSLELGSSLVVAEAINASGQKAVAYLEGPQGYKLTAITSLEIIRKILEGDFKVGYQTPGSAYGWKWVEGLEGFSIR